MRRVAMVLFAVGYAGCAPTRFYGSPRLENGPAGCRASCDAWGMELGGMVKMGEYSEGCICLVKPDAKPPPPASETPAPRSDASTPLGATAGGAIAAAAGVYLQMLEAEQQAQQHPHHGGSTPEPYRHPYVPHSPIGSPGWRPGLP